MNLWACRTLLRVYCRTLLFLASFLFTQRGSFLVRTDRQTFSDETIHKFESRFELNILLTYKCRSDKEQTRLGKYLIWKHLLSLFNYWYNVVGVNVTIRFICDATKVLSKCERWAELNFLFAHDIFTPFDFINQETLLENCIWTVRQIFCFVISKRNQEIIGNNEEKPPFTFFQPKISFATCSKFLLFFF